MTDNFRLLSYYYARAAQLQERCGMDYNDALKSAKQQREYGKEMNALSFTPADLLPDAIIAATEKKIVQSLPMPSPQKIAQAFLHNPHDTALISYSVHHFSKDEMHIFESSIPEKELKTFNKALIMVLSDGKAYVDKLDKYLSDETYIPFLKNLLFEYPDCVNTVFNLLDAYPDFSPSRQGDQLLSNLKKTDFLLGTGNFADLCKKAFPPSMFVMPSEKLEKELRKVIKTNIQEAVRQKNTQGLIDILDANPSEYVLAQIETAQLMKSLLAETVEGEYKERHIKTFVDWVNRMKGEQREDELSRILHGFGAKAESEPNNRAQAFLFALFILPAQEKLKSAQAVKFDRTSLFQAGQTVINILSQKKTDIGIRFKKEKEHLENAVVEECAFPNDESGYSTEIEVFYLDEHQRDGYGFEFITPIREDVEKAFRIGSAFVRLNEVLKKAGLLWPPAGHSIHTHVSAFTEYAHTNSMKELFGTLSTLCFFPINPVDREEYLLRKRSQGLITVDSIPRSLNKIQNRQGMILDRLSFDIVKDLAQYAKKIFVDRSHNNQAEQHIKKTIQKVTAIVSSYDVLEALYDSLPAGALDDHKREEMFELLSHQLDQAQTAETRIKTELRDMKKRKLEGDKHITKAMLEKKATEAREASEGNINIDYFFLLGKEMRDECARLLHVELWKALHSL